MVEYTWYQRTLKSVSGRSKKTPFSSGPSLLHDDHGEQVDEDAGAADQAEPEEQHPVVPVADEDEMPQAVHDRLRIPNPPEQDDRGGRSPARVPTMTGTRDMCRSTREENAAQQHATGGTVAPGAADQQVDRVGGQVRQGVDHRPVHQPPGRLQLRRQGREGLGRGPPGTPALLLPTEASDVTERGDHPGVRDHGQHRQRGAQALRRASRRGEGGMAVRGVHDRRPRPVQGRCPRSSRSPTAPGHRARSSPGASVRPCCRGWSAAARGSSGSPARRPCPDRPRPGRAARATPSRHRCCGTRPADGVGQPSLGRGQQPFGLLTARTPPIPRRPGPDRWGPARGRR